MNRSFIKLFCLVFAVCFSIQGADFVLVANGKAQASVQFNNPYCKKYAEILADYVKKSSGAELTIGKSVPSGKTVHLQINMDKHADREEFTFTFPDENTLVISGGCENGLKFGVYSFLDRYLGLKRLFPGKLGDVLPKKSTIAVPRTPVKDAPKYLSRYLGTGAYTRDTKEFYDWSRSLGANNPRIWMGHFLFFLLPVEKYGKTHPEFYPVFNGKRCIPNPGQQTAWQPCFTAPGIAEEIAKNAILKLEKSRNLSERIRNSYEIVNDDPRKFTAPLGINDAGGFCECDRCRKANGTRINFVGRPDCSGSYVPFLNKAANLITAKYPGTKIPFLAYNNVSEIPAGTGKLNPALIPEITFDSMYLADPERKATFRRVIRAWNASVPELGNGDYIWGKHFLIPRVYFKQLSEHLLWNYQNGIRHYYAEFVPGHDWTEGPKAYLVLKLLWDPDRDPQSILKEWYEYAVGKAAAPVLQEYFERIEQYWTKDIRSTEWFREPRVYCSYGNAGYLDAYKPEYLAKSEELLNRVVELAGTPEEKERAVYFRKLFLDRKPLIQAFWKVRETRLKAEKMDFSDVLYRADFDSYPKTLDTWQRAGRHAKFFRDETGGVDHTACIGIDAEGSRSGPALYEARIPVRKKRTFRVTVQCRIEPDAGAGTSAGLAVYWRDTKNRMLSSTYRVEQKYRGPKDDEWQTLTVYTTTPAEGNLQLCAGLSITGTDKGKIRFDNLKIDAVPLEIPEEEKYTAVLLKHDFEKPEQKWSTWQSGKSGKISFQWDAKGGRNGTAGILIDSSGDTEKAAGMYVSDIPVKPGQKLLFYAWVKVSPDTAANAVVRVSGEFRNREKKAIAGTNRYAEYPAVRDGIWRKLFFITGVPEGASFIRLVMSTRRAAPGSVRFDEAALLARPQ